MIGQARMRVTEYGRTVVKKRWRLTLPDSCVRRVAYTWAQTKAGAAAKCLVHRGVRPVDVEPAPAELNMVIRDAIADMAEAGDTEYAAASSADEAREIIEDGRGALEIIEDGRGAR